MRVTSQVSNLGTTLRNNVTDATKRYGADSEEVAAALLQLGKFYSVNHGYKYAEETLKQASLLYRKHKGPLSREYASALYWLGANYNNEHRYAQADSVFVDVIRVRTEDKDWGGLADVYCEKAMALASQGAHDKATDTLLKSIDFRCRTKDTTNPLWQVSFAVLSRELRAGDQTEMAETTFQNAVDQVWQAHGSTANSTLIGLQQFADLCVKLNNYEKAADLYKRVLEGNDSSHALSNDVLTDVINADISVLVHLGRADESAQVETRLLSIKNSGELARWESIVQTQPLVASNHVGLAQVLKSLGRLDEAAAECNAALNLDPSDSMASKLLADLKQAQGSAAPPQTTTAIRSSTPMPPPATTPPAATGSPNFSQPPP